MAKMRRIALWIWYRGDRFRGFQAQVEGPTVQGALEQALARAGLTGKVVPAGRTDRGVHARMQVVRLRVPASLAADELAAHLRPLLPEGLGIAAAQDAPQGFHPQWSALGKEYRYRLQLEGRAPPGWGEVSWIPSSHPRLSGAPVPPERLASLLRSCEGERDFAAFHAASSVRRTRHLASAELCALGGGLYDARLRGSGFGRYQVRVLVGTAALTAAGVLEPEAFLAALQKAQPLDGLRAPGEALVLWEVAYPAAVDPFARDRVQPAVPPFPPFSDGTG